MLVAAPLLDDIVRQEMEARNARPERFRDQKRLNEQKCRPLFKTTKAHANAIARTTTEAIRVALQQHIHALSSDPSWLERTNHYIQRLTDLLKGQGTSFITDRSLPECLHSMTYRIFHYPVTFADMRKDLIKKLDEHVKKMLREIHWIAEDRDRHGPRMLVAAVRPWIEEIERSVSLGMRYILQHRATNAIDVAKLWIAFNYAWGRYRHTCVLAGFPRAVEHDPNIGNTNIPPPAIPQLLVQKPPPPTRGEIGTQTTVPLGRSHSI